MRSISYKFVLGFFLSFNFLAAQEAKVKEVKIYNNKDGVKNINPKTILEVSKNKIQVYKVVDGIKELNPIKIIEDKKTFLVKEGIKELLPIEEFEAVIINN